MRKATAFLLVFFLVLQLVLAPQVKADQVTITCGTDKASYAPEELVTIQGKVLLDGDPLSEATVGIQVNDSRGNPIYVNQVLSGADGGFSDSFRLKKDAPTGEYQGWAACQGATVPFNFLVGKSEKDTNPPRSQILSPQNGATITAVPVQIKGTAEDDRGVAKVEVSFDGGKTWNLASGTTSWSMLWFPENGNYTIQSRATDTSGNVETPQGGVSVKVNVPSSPPADTTPPTSSISFPAPGAVITSMPLVIQGTASDDQGVLKVEVSLDGGQTWLLATGTEAWNLTIYLPNGNYTAITRATDLSQNQESPSFKVSFTVSTSLPAPADTIPPVLVVFYPQDFSIFARPEVPIIGQTEPNAILTINGASVPLDENGNFNYELTLAQGENLITVIAEDAALNQAKVVLHVTYQPEVSPSECPFLDLIDHWACADITELFNKGIVKGYPDGLFHPERSITRAEFCKLIVLALGLETKTQSSETFQDVPLSHWAASYVQAAFEAGIVKGRGEGLFAPEDNITRAEMATMIGRALNLDPSGTSIFVDSADIPEYARGYVASCAERGIIKGYPDGSFRPLGLANRAEACTIVLRLIKSASP